MPQDIKKVLNVKFTKAKDFKYIAATGAWGGPTPQGEILCNFFIESRPEPDGLEVTIDQNTKKVQERKIGEVDVFIRELQVGVLLRPDIARAIGEWLVQKANEVTFQEPHVKH